jgi:putative DNA primase/helicase
MNGQKPQALIAKIDPEPYPLDALPATIRAAVEEVQAFTKAPVSLVASSG